MYSGGDGIQLSINKPKPSVATKRNPGFLIGPLFSPATFSLLPIPSWPLCLLLKIQLVGFSVLTPLPHLSYGSSASLLRILLPLSGHVHQRGRVDPQSLQVAPANLIYSNLNQTRGTHSPYPHGLRCENVMQLGP